VRSRRDGEGTAAGQRKRKYSGGDKGGPSGQHAVFVLQDVTGDGKHRHPERFLSSDAKFRSSSGVLQTVETRRDGE
jgi:hypothetical protein